MLSVERIDKFFSFINSGMSSSQKNENLKELGRIFHQNVVSVLQQNLSEILPELEFERHRRIAELTEECREFDKLTTEWLEFQSQQIDLQKVLRRNELCAQLLRELNSDVPLSLVKLQTQTLDKLDHIEKIEFILKNAVNPISELNYLRHNPIEIDSLDEERQKELLQKLDDQFSHRELAQYIIEKYEEVMRDNREFFMRLEYYPPRPGPKFRVKDFCLTLSQVQASGGRVQKSRWI